MTLRILVAATGLALALASPGWAQTTVTTTTTATAPTGNFNSLSPGNQKIANALFSAQKTTGTTLTPLTKNQIAGLKGTEGWGRVFKTMKANGLIHARNLGQVVSGYNHSLRSSTTSTATTCTSSSRSTPAPAASATVSTSTWSR